MTFKRPTSAGLAALAVGLFATTAAYAAPTINKGDNAWVMTSAVLVLLMTIPGLALFYGGLVRSKNMLSVLAQVFYTVCIVAIIWAIYGYSLAFTGGSEFIGGFSKAFMAGVTTDSAAGTFSVDANMLHTSSEGKALENPAEEAPDYVYQRTVSPEDAPDTPEYIEVTFEKGDPVAINGVTMSPATVLETLNDYGRKHGVGRLDFVENRFVGMKSRGIYETPGGTILLEAHRGIEQITLDAGAGHLKDSLMPRYAELIYNGFWFSPEREMLQALIDKSQEHVTGTVRLKLYKGSVNTVGRWSDHSLYSEKHVTFEDDAGAYDQKDAAGFIKLNALRLKLIGNRNAKFK